MQKNMKTYEYSNYDIHHSLQSLILQKHQFKIFLIFYKDC